MKWFKKKKIEPQPQPETDIGVDQPTLIIRVVDNMDLEIVVEWPEGKDVKGFSKMLTLLNSGYLVEAQVAAATMYASKVNQMDKLKLIKEGLHGSSMIRKSNKSSDRPLVPPSKFIQNQIKINQG